MSEKKDKKDKSPELKRSWFQGLKAEFKKITWPTKDRLFKETAVVSVVAILLGAIIVLVDYALQAGLNLFY